MDEYQKKRLTKWAFCNWLILKGMGLVGQKRAGAEK
jgi:hypothetical protein